MVFSYLYCGCRSPQDIIRCCIGIFTVIDEDGDGSGPSYTSTSISNAEIEHLFFYSLPSWVTFYYFILLVSLYLVAFRCFLFTPTLCLLLVVFSSPINLFFWSPVDLNKIILSYHTSKLLWENSLPSSLGVV